MARDWEDRVGEYVDSPRMRRRIKVGREIACTIDGRYGTYATRIDLARKDGDACTCPVGEGGAGCKHTEALRRTYRLRPRSFVDVDALLGELAARRKADLLELIRAMVVQAPAALGALGVRGFEDAEPEDSFDERPTEGPTRLRPKAPRRPRPSHRAMCSVCDDPALDAYRERERVAAGEGWRCEHVRDEAGGPCGSPATWRERFAVALDHLCDAHRAESVGIEAGGLGRLMRETGLGDASYYLAVEGRERCEFADPRTTCNRPARWVEVSALSTFACEAHVDAE